MVLTSARGRFRLDPEGVAFKTCFPCRVGPLVHGFGDVGSFCEFKRVMNKFMNKEFVQGY